MSWDDEPEREEDEELNIIAVLRLIAAHRDEYENLRERVTFEEREAQLLKMLGVLERRIDRHEELNPGMLNVPALQESLRLCHERQGSLEVLLREKVE